MKRPIEETGDSDEDDDPWHQISVACYKQYDSFPSRGKPSSNEWTHLAGFVSFDKETKEVRVLSLGTGTKCLGGTKDERGTEGCLLQDSHAEIIARRSLLRLFYEEILSNGDSLLVPVKDQEKKYQLKESLCLYMFVSAPPCGLAAHVADPIKRPKLEHKSLHSVDDDLFLKPGKGSATTSLSCTNKIKRWIYQGLEGRLLNQFIPSPIRLSGLIITTTADLSAIFAPVPVHSIRPSFTYGPSKDRSRPSSLSLAWWSSLDLPSPVLTANGYPLGQVRRCQHQQQYANPLAKCSLFRLYLRWNDHLPVETTTYAQAKSFSSNSLRDEFMAKHSGWLQTDSETFYSFTLH